MFHQTSQRAHDAIVTSSLRPNDVADVVLTQWRRYHCVIIASILWLLIPWLLTPVPQRPWYQICRKKCFFLFPEGRFQLFVTFGVSRNDWKTCIPPNHNYPKSYCPEWARVIARCETLLLYQSEVCQHIAAPDFDEVNTGKFTKT